jgi:hypothetical protein
MTMEEYFKFLEEYWKIFGPPPPPKPKIPYKKILI